jgi:hypothetical protein
MPERHTCTADDPWSPAKSRSAIHPDAVEVGEQQDGWPGGDIVTRRCPHCGHKWEEELPQ